MAAPHGVPNKNILAHIFHIKGFNVADQEKEDGEQAAAPDQARARQYEALALAHELAHHPSLASAQAWASIFYAWYRDVQATQEQAEAAIDLQKMNWKCRTGVHEQTGVSLQRHFGPT